MTALFSRWLPCLTLASWSAILLHFAQAPQNGFWQGIAARTFLFSGRVNDFLVPGFRPYVLIAGFVLALMALAFLFFPADAECCSASECGHPLSRVGGGKWLTFLVLIVPVGAAAVMTPDNFSKAVVQNRGVATNAEELGLPARAGAYAPPEFPLPTPDQNFDDNSVETPNGPMTPQTDAASNPAPATASTAPAAPNDYVKRTSEGYLMVEVLDMLWSVQDVNMRKIFEDKTVTLTAQMMPADSNNPSAARFKAVRMFMTCCAADARPVAAVIEAPTLPDLPEMTWFTVVGKATFPIEGGKRVAIIKADSVTKVEPPEESMLY